MIEAVARWRLWQIYLCLGLPIGLFLIVALPPLQMPDEQTHFLRAVYLSRGHLVAHRLSASNAGGAVPSDAVRFAWSFDDMKGHGERKFDLDRLRAVQNGSLSSPLIPTGFPNTAVYPPFFYMPAATALLAARLGHLPMACAYYLSRFGCLVAALGVSALAIALITRGALLLAMILSLPMTLSLFAACSQEGLLIAATALAVALCTRVQTRTEAVVLAVLLAMIAGTKLPYLPLVALPVVFAPRARAAWLQAVAGLGGALACAAIFTRPAKIPFLVDQGVNAGRQMALVLHHPLRWVRTLLCTMHIQGPSFAKQFIGVLGWLDTLLPDWSYVALSGLLVTGGVLSLRTLGPQGLADVEIWPRIGVAVIGSIATLGVFGSLYLIWTPVGHDIICGIQGRYFIPLSLLVCLILPRGVRTASLQIRAVDGALLAGFLGCVALSLHIGIMVRYW
ncbi:hypothetical protein AA103193_2977 [Tanticharoenia sakaeratensis NBRC 103193]|nr:hypothetical protein AA103193_2977 [Tanticharoenia sakaeratensis NBRC 103193]